MNYLRDFYKQSGDFQTTLSYTDLGSYSPASFGLSGGSVLNFNVQDGLVFCDGTLITSLDETASVFLTVAGNGSRSTVWIDERPVFHRSGTLSFDKIYANSATDFVFTESLFGEQPTLNINFSGWNGQTGYLYVGNTGGDTLEITTALIDGSYVAVSSFPSSIAPGSSGLFTLNYLSNSTTSGTGQLVLDTNAGNYSLGQFFEYEWVNNFGNFDIYFESGFYNPTGYSKFFIQNRYQRDIDVGVFLDNNDLVFITDESGVQFVTNSGEELAIASPRYATVRATGLFSNFIGATVNGPTTVPVSYHGRVTGVGGNLGITGIENVSGTTNIVIYPEGPITYDYTEVALGKISGVTYQGLLFGTLSGTVGPGSGVYHFNTQVTGVPVIALNLATNETFVPPGGSIFTGVVNEVVDLASSVIGTYSYYAFHDIEIYEGDGRYLDLWDIEVHDLDRGVEDYRTLGRYTDLGFGESGSPLHRIPVEGRITGYVRYHNNYSKPILSKMNLRITDFNSINEQISIESR